MGKLIWRLPYALTVWLVIWLVNEITKLERERVFLRERIRTAEAYRERQNVPATVVINQAEVPFDVHAIAHHLRSSQIHRFPG